MACWGLPNDSIFLEMTMLQLGELPQWSSGLASSSMFLEKVVSVTRECKNKHVRVLSSNFLFVLLTTQVILVRKVYKLRDIYISYLVIFKVILGLGN